MYKIVQLFCLGLFMCDAVDLSKARHLLRRRQTFDPNALPAESFVPGGYKADRFNPSSYTAQPYDPIVYNNPNYSPGGKGLAQITRQDPNNFESGAVQGGQKKGYNYNPSSFLNPMPQLTNGKTVPVSSASGGSSSYFSSYNAGVNANSNFDPNVINSMDGRLGQTGTKGQDQSERIRQTGDSFVPMGGGRQTGGVYDPNTDNSMLSAPPFQSRVPLSQTGSMSSATNFNPNSLSSMSATQTG